MKIQVRNTEDLDREAFRVICKGREYLIKECAEGIHIILCENVGELLVRPQTGNSIIIKAGE